MNEYSILFVKVLDYEFKKFETFFELKVLDTFKNWRIIKMNSLILK